MAASGAELAAFRGLAYLPEPITAPAPLVPALVLPLSKYSNRPLPSRVISALILSRSFFCALPLSTAMTDGICARKKIITAIARNIPATTNDTIPV
jgi:hypothetical protein